MCLRKRPLHRTTSIGLILLAVANVAGYILTRHTSLSEHVADPIAGVMMGAAIALLLVGIHQQGRSLGA